MNLNIAELRKRFQPSTALALTLASGEISVSFLAGEGGKVSRTLSIPVGAEEICRDPEKAGAKLAAALDEAGIRSRRCVVCIPPGWALSASTDLPDVGAEDLRSYLELCAEREFPVAVNELRLAHSPYVLPDGTRRATLAAVPAKRMEALEKMLETAKCRPVSVSLSLDDCLLESKPALFFLANGTHTDVVVTAGGGVVSMRSLASSPDSGETPFDPVSFNREIRITLGRLPEAIRQQVREARFGGTPSSAQKLCAETRDQLIRLGMEKVECPSGDAAGMPAAAVGAAEFFLQGKPVAFEFVVPEVNRAQVLFRKFDSRQHRWIVAAAAGIILLPVLVMFIRNLQENHLVSRWDGMKKNVAELDALQQKIHKFRPWFEPAPQVLQVMESVVAAFPEQGDVWAKSVQVTEGYKVTCTGFARNQPALLAVLDRLRARKNVTAVQVQQMRGDNPVQFSFTCKWGGVQ